MSTARYVHWRDGNMWLGYFEQFPEYLTQGETLSDLEEHLHDLYQDLIKRRGSSIRTVPVPPTANR